MSAAQKDNSTFEKKAALRARSLMLMNKPVVMETHGGYGKIYQRCYRHLPTGIVFENDEVKVAALALQRPTWAVYESACESGIGAGVGSHLPVNFLDLDPYGEPWPAVDAFFGSRRPFPEKLIVVVNDGLRQKLRMQGGWAVGSLQKMVQKLGNSGLYNSYLEICRDMLAEKAARAQYRMTRWTGYYCGHQEQMTHYAAVFEK